jgi:hypothetical protein
LTETHAVAGCRLGKTLKNPFLYLDAPAGLLYPSELGNTLAALSYPRAVICAAAFIAALVIRGVLGGVSLLFVPPFIDWDSANWLLVVCT